MTLHSIPTSTLRRELARRESGARKLQAEYAAFAKRIAGLEAELADLGVDAAPDRHGRKPNRGPGRRGPGRPKGSKNKPGKVGRPRGSKNKRAKNAMTLPEAIAKGVKVGATVSPADADTAAKKAGYKSTSANFGMIVANALAKAGNFKKLGRGQYRRLR